MAYTAQLSADVRLGSFASDVASSKLFGANFLAARDDLNGTFGSVVREIGVTNLRFPGGGDAEALFDITNPDALFTDNDGGSHRLSEFLAFCSQHNITPTIVIPTKVWVNNIDAGKVAVQQFVADVTAGVYGPADDMCLEIGNEYYSTSREMPPINEIDYAAVASAFAPVIAEAAQSPITLSVQAGRTLEANTIILNEFDTHEERMSLDSITLHNYPWRFESVQSRGDDRAEIYHAWRDAGLDLDLYVSEWNIGSSGDDSLDSEHDYGMPQLSAMLEMVANSLVIGVDAADVWAVQQSNKTSLAADEGYGRIWAAGHLFRMMADDIPGKRLVANTDPSPNAEGLEVYAYEDDTEVVLFVSARDMIDEAAGDTLVASINLSGMGASFAHVWGEQLTTWVDEDSYRPPAILRQFDPTLTATATGSTLALEIDSDFDVFKVVLSKSNVGDDNMFVEGTDSDEQISTNAGDDVVAGGRGRDVINGGDGHDLIRGGGSADRLFGGEGHDELYGDRHRDRLYGEAGYDELYGGSKKDRLFGGDGHDVLDGGRGKDLLDGGAGRDILDGGRGNDRLIGGADGDTFVFANAFGDDIVRDFDSHVDTIRIVGVPEARGARDVMNNHATQVGEDVLILFNESSILLENVYLDELTAGNFTFG